MKARQALNILFPALLALGVPGLSRSQVHLAATREDHVSIEINGQPFSDFYFGHAYAKPFLAPLRSAAGQIVTRQFPMKEVEGESRDHPHHKGLWIGFGDVNHVNFWETETESRPSGDNPKSKGKIELEKIDEVKSGGKSGSVSATFAWTTPDGVTLMDEARTLTFYADAKIRRLDVDSTFHARQAVQFADTKEGFFAVRVADSMTGKNGGIITNSEGAHTEKDVWGKHADWVDYVGTVDGHKLGILILDWGRNPNHPPRWHARDYGLFADNPFGAKAFDPHTNEKSGYQLEPGARTHFRYRVIVHAGDVSKKQMADWYRDFAKEAK